MAAENHINLVFTDERIRVTVLTNICRMLVTRGYMDADKYKPADDAKDAKDVKAYPVDQPSIDDPIDNQRFAPLIRARTDTGIYTIPLDRPYENERSKEDKEKPFNPDKLVIKLVHQVVKDITNSQNINDFLKSYPMYHKIIVFDGMADKVYDVLRRKKNVEVFDRDFFMIDLMSHVCAPIRCELVTEEAIGYMVNPKIAKILENDPLVRYYNGKRNSILRIVRPSLTNSVEVAYRRVVEPKSVFK